MQKFQNLKKKVQEFPKAGSVFFCTVNWEKKKLFSDFQNQGGSDVDNQTIFFGLSARLGWLIAETARTDFCTLNLTQVRHACSSYVLPPKTFFISKMTVLRHSVHYRIGLFTLLHDLLFVGRASVWRVNSLL